MPRSPFQLEMTGATEKVCTPVNTFAVNVLGIVVEPATNVLTA